MSLVPSMVSSRIPSRSRFSNELDRSCMSISSSLGVGVRWSLGVSSPGTAEVPVSLSLVHAHVLGWYLYHDEFLVRMIVRDGQIVSQAARLWMILASRLAPGQLLSNPLHYCPWESSM